MQMRSCLIVSYLGQVSRCGSARLSSSLEGCQATCVVFCSWRGTVDATSADPHQNPVPCLET